MKYRLCNGGCTHDGTHCNGCGRSHEDVAKVNHLVKELAAYAKKWTMTTLKTTPILAPQAFITN